jgi:hypothetical protein
MNKLRLLWVQNFGKIINIDYNEIPQELGLEGWMEYLKTYKINFTDKFASKDGYLLGNMQQGSREIDATFSNEINDAINYLQYLLEEIDRISGVSKQRQGNIAPREGLGVTQHAISQSTHQTEPFYLGFDAVIVKAAQLFIEYAKVLWKDDKSLRQYALDDLSNYLIDFDGELLNEAEFGVQITNGSRNYELNEMMKQLSHAAMQTGTATMSDIAKMSMATSTTEMILRLEASEDKRFKQQQEQQQAQINAQKEMQQQMMEIENKKFEQEIEKIRLQHQQKIELEMLKIKYNIDKDYNDGNRNFIDDDVELEMKQIDKEMTKMKITSEEKMLDKELQVKKEIEMAKIRSAANKPSK